MVDNTYLTIFCIVDGALLSQAFPVSIHPSQTVGHLKKLIKVEQSPDFDDITADKLILWKATVTHDYTFSSLVSVDMLRGDKTRLYNPRAGLYSLFPTDPLDNVYILVQRPPRPSFQVYPPVPVPSYDSSIDPPVKSIDPESKRDESTPVNVLATSKNNDNNNNNNNSTSLFTGWQLVPASGCADRDGFLLCTSHFNGSMAGHTSNVQRFFDSRRDKYGQGMNSVLMPVMENEAYNVLGAERVWFLGLRKVNVNHREVVVPVIDVDLQ